jgi:hypothetical protein
MLPFIPSLPVTADHMAALARLATAHRTTVPQPPVKRLRHSHDQRRGLVLEVGQSVPEYYGRRNDVVIAILGGDPFLVVTRTGDEILVGQHAVEEVGHFGENDGPFEDERLGRHDDGKEEEQ